VAFSYVGPELTAPIYREGTMGRAKAHLEATAAGVRRLLEPLGGAAWVSVNKALVTRASAVIPGVPLYIALLYTVMKRRGLHEECIDQMNRLLREQLYGGRPPRTDPEGRIRLDDLEMRADVQEEVARRWEEISAGMREAAGGEARVRAMPAELFRVFREEFLRHHGFCMEGVDYGADVEV
jgi:enoyl-[acyl-carrier protein] reductase/trans-2-enoyl-CoA reductase (NAD+)